MSRFSWIAIGILALLSVILRNQLLLLMSMTLALLATASYYWAKYCLAGVTYVRHFTQKRLFFGEETEMQLEVTNAKPLPLAWLRVDDSYPSALEVVSLHRTDDDGTLKSRRLVNVFSLRWYERVTRRYRLRGTQRGIWAFGPTNLRSGDMFGFDIRRATLDATDSIVVYPLILPVSQLGLPARHPLGDFTTPRRMADDPLRLMGTRDYAQGDNFRHIHWKASARRQTLQTKVFEPSAARPVAIFLNIDTNDIFNRSQDYELREFAICAAASVARQVWERGDAVGLFANALISHRRAEASNASGRVRIQPRKHPSQLIRILETLARIDEGRGRWSLPALLAAEGVNLPYGATLVVVSATMEPRLRLALADMQRRGYGVVLLGLGAGHLDKPIRGVTHYYIGGRERWRELEALEARVL